MDNQTFNITHNKFVKLAPSVIKNLTNDEHFADVTLVSSDNRQIKAHKVILSSSSTFLKNILIKNPHPNPLIYLKGITFTNLQLIINFIYLDECVVPVKEVNDFINVGKELEIERLMEEVQEPGYEYTDYENQLLTPEETIEYDENHLMTGETENQIDNLCHSC